MSLIRLETTNIRSVCMSTFSFYQRTYSINLDSLAFTFDYAIKCWVFNI
jgi:hypothetical protein